jgi:hypothetical protein
MKSDRDTLDERLKALDPVSPADLHDDAPEEVLEAILAVDPEQADPTPVRRRSDRRLVRRWALVPVAAALAATLVLAAGLPHSDEDGDGVSAVLTDVAAAAAAQAPTTAEGPYLYLETRSMSVDTAIAQGQVWSVYRSETREEWVSADGAGLVRTEKEPPAFVGPEDRAAWEAAGSPNFASLGSSVRTTERTLPAGSFEDVSDLPTDSAELSRRLQGEAEETHKSAPVPARALELIGEALRNPTATPELRAALYEAALQVPGIEYQGPATDPTGREGLAVGVTSSYSGGPTVYSLVYDPQSTNVLANEAKTLKPEFADAEGPLVTSATVYLDSGSASALPE